LCVDLENGTINMVNKIIIMQKIKSGIYQHYKGGEYKVHFVSKHSETLEEFVVYEALYDNPTSKFWIRPIELFIDEVEWEGKTMPRFEFLSEK